MNRHDRRKAQALEDRAHKAWQERDKLENEILENWLKKGDMNAEEFEQLGDTVRNEITDVINYHKVSVGMVRCVLMSMMGESLARYATDLPQVESDAVLFGGVLVQLSMEAFERNHVAAEVE